MGGLDYTSFVRVTGYNSLLSATDVAYAVTALLEVETQASAVGGEQAAFYIAFDALNTNQSSTSPFSNNASLGHGSCVSDLVNGGALSGNVGIGAGIRLALALQKATYKTAIGLIERNAIVRLRHFRYAFLNCTNQDQRNSAQHNERRTGKEKMDGQAKSSMHLFGKPLALNKLAHFLMEMHRQNGKWTGAKARPLVLLAERPETRTYLVVGFEHIEQSGSFVRNKFGQHFRMTASSMNGSFVFDSFESNVVEVDIKDAQRFVEQLHYFLDSA